MKNGETTRDCRLHSDNFPRKALGAKLAWPGHVSPTS